MQGFCRRGAPTLEQKGLNKYRRTSLNNLELSKAYFGNGRDIIQSLSYDAVMYYIHLW